MLRIGEGEKSDRERRGEEQEKERKRKGKQTSHSLVLENVEQRKRGIE